MPDSRFWTDVTPLGSVHYRGFPSFELKNIPASFRYHLYRHTDSDWYLMGDGNGQMWKLDSNRTWQRLDNTFYMGYDFHSSFIYPNMKYGGYGYWRTNGMLRHFREKTGEWESVPLSRELPIWGGYCHYNYIKHKLVQSGSMIMQSAVKTEIIAIDSLFELDMHNMEWATIGALNPEAIYFLSPKSWLTSIETPNGRLMYPFLGDTCALVDYITMTCTIPGAKSVNTFRTFIQPVKQGSILVSTGYGLLVVDTTDFSIDDSLSWAELQSDPKAVLPIIKPSDSNSGSWDSKSIYVTGAFVSLIVGAGTWMVIRRKKRTGSTTHHSSGAHGLSTHKEITESRTLTFTLIVDDNQILFNNEPIQEQLNHQESLLLRILVDKKRHDQALNTIQFNELLGIDTRSPDNQKKIRSEVVKGINTAFHEQGFPYEAIRRVRHAEDRRMMMYFLHDSIGVSTSN